MSLAVSKGIFDALSTSQELETIVGDRIYHGQAEEGAAFPYVIFSKVPAGPKIRTLKKGATVVREIWLVKAVDRGESASVAEEAAEVIDAILDEESLSVPGRTVIDLYHVADVSYPENDGDQSYRHEGANYGVVLA